MNTKEAILKLRSMSVEGNPLNIYLHPALLKSVLEVTGGVIVEGGRICKIEHRNISVLSNRVWVRRINR